MGEGAGSQLCLPFSTAVAAPTAPAGSARETRLQASRIAGYLTVRLPEPVDVALTRNRSTMISYSSRGGRLRVRLHRMFRQADDEILEALARYIGKRDRSSSAAINRFIEEHRGEVDEARARRPVQVRAAGSHHDLEQVLESVSGTYFGGSLGVRIGWGRRVKRRRRRGRASSRALASYSFDDRIVRVHPVLDSERVPAFVLEWIVYHELLHHVLPVEEEGGRNQYHTRRFRALERAFDRYEEAIEWERANRDWLLG